MEKRRWWFRYGFLALMAIIFATSSQVGEQAAWADQQTAAIAANPADGLRSNLPPTSPDPAVTAATLRTNPGPSLVSLGSGPPAGNDQVRLDTLRDLTRYILGLAVLFLLVEFGLLWR